jgi:hypothetical protein
MRTLLILSAGYIILRKGVAGYPVILPLFLCTYCSTIGDM